ncbi:MAG: hypothetical protein N4A40_12990 [Tissierellales bacterium]|jgi:hypothetical protein|nr:hypothetical protein [Tissierellales bacterium]
MICSNIEYGVYIDSREKDNDRQFIEVLFEEFHQEGFMIQDIIVNKDALVDSVKVDEYVVRPKLKNKKNNEVIVVLSDCIVYQIGSKIENGKLREVNNDTERSKNIIHRIINKLDNKVTKVSFTSESFVENKFLIDPKGCNSFLSGLASLKRENKVQFNEQMGDDIINICHNSFMYDKIMKFYSKMNSQIFEFKGTRINNDFNIEILNDENYYEEEINSYFDKFIELNNKINKEIRYE